MHASRRSIDHRPLSSSCRLAAFDPPLLSCATELSRLRTSLRLIDLRSLSTCVHRQLAKHRTRQCDCLARRLEVGLEYTLNTLGSLVCIHLPGRDLTHILAQARYFFSRLDRCRAPAMDSDGPLLSRSILLIYCTSVCLCLFSARVNSSLLSPARALLSFAGVYFSFLGAMLLTSSHHSRAYLPLS